LGKDREKKRTQKKRFDLGGCGGTRRGRNWGEPMKDLATSQIKGGRLIKGVHRDWGKCTTLGKKEWRVIE